MRNLCRSALVGLSAVVVLLGVTPAADAANSSLSWSQGSGVLWPGFDPVVCPTAQAFESGQTLVVQVLEGGAWVDKATYSLGLTDGWCYSVNPTALVSGPGTYSFRALSRVPSTGELLTTDEVSYTLQQDDGQFIWLDPGMFEATRDWMGSGLRLSTRSATDLTTHLQIFHSHGQVVELQRKSGSAWVTVSNAQAPAAGENVTLPLRIPARAGLAQHRFVSQATAWSPTVVTPAFTVYQAAVINRASYIAEARAYMAAYCPQTPLFIDTPAVRSGPHLGQASVSFGRSRGRKVLATKIELRSGMMPDQLRGVALHECGHIMQYRSMVPGRYSDVQKQAGKLWPGLGVEGQADCMSYQITRDDHWFGYVSGCSQAQLLNAAKMWQTYGGKYQAAVYRW